MDFNQWEAEWCRRAARKAESDYLHLEIWGEIETVLREKSPEERERYRQILKDDIKEHASKDETKGDTLFVSLRNGFYEDLDDFVHEDASIISLLIYQHILTFLISDLYQDTEILNKRREAKEWAKRISEGEDPDDPELKKIEPEPGFRSMMMTWDYQGRLRLMMPNEPVGRPPKKTENTLIRGLFYLLERSGYCLGDEEKGELKTDRKKDIYMEIKEILYAFFKLDKSIDTIKKTVQRHSV